MGRNNKVQKRARKARNRARHEALLVPRGEPRNRWQGSIALRFGPHPDAVFRVTWSGVKIPVDLTDPNHMDGVVELTELALQGQDAEVN
jgi:hypothetical protein